jgi:hypothetical protein
MYHRIILFAIVALNFAASLVPLSALGQQRPDELPSAIPNRPAPPIPIEVFVGTQGLNFQMIVSKHFSPESRIGFFNVTSFVGTYSNEQKRNQYLAQAFLTADIWDALSFNAGMSMNYFSGFRPSAGLQYVKGGREYLLVVLPRFDLSESFNFETFGLFEYKPQLSAEWSLYSRLQALYNHNTREGFHDRSYVYARIGASFHNVQFGIGANVDFYGPQRINENSIGVFFRTELF